jgi:hypothetical protein
MAAFRELIGKSDAPTIDLQNHWHQLNKFASATRQTSMQFKRENAPRPSRTEPQTEPPHRADLGCQARTGANNDTALIFVFQ